MLLGIFLCFVNVQIIFSATEVGAKLTAYLLDHVIPRWCSPRTLARNALSAAAFLVGTLVLPLSFPLLVLSRIAFMTPHVILAPEWRFPSDGLDDLTRRFGKQWCVLSYHLLAFVAIKYLGR